MREQSCIGNITVDGCFYARPNPRDASCGSPLMRIDHINPAPVPLLEIDSSLTILMISCNNQFAALAKRDQMRDLKFLAARPLRSHDRSLFHRSVPSLDRPDRRGEHQH